LKGKGRSQTFSCHLHAGVDFTNILLGAFTLADPKSAKIQSSRQSFLGFWDLHGVKASFYPATMGIRYLSVYPIPVSERSLQTKKYIFECLLIYLVSKHLKSRISVEKGEKRSTKNKKNQEESVCSS